MSFNANRNLVEGFSPNDGTIDFYLRINALVKDTDAVLDLGAGAGSWYENDKCDVRKSVRNLKGKAHKVIAADLDDAVLQNRVSDIQLLIKDGSIDLKDESVDLIIADFVLGYVAAPKTFAS